jgi:hypothetical protein
MRSGAVVALVIGGACGGRDAAKPDAAPAADARPDATQTKMAQVSVASDNTTNSTLVLGVFGTDLDINVTTRNEGPCLIRQAAAGSSPFVSAGTLSVTGANDSITIPYDAAGYFAMRSGLIFAANDQLDIMATGATVPAFSTRVAVPTNVTVTSGSPTSIRKSGFTVTWNPTASQVVVRIRQYASGAPKLSITCQFEGMAGTGSVPAAALVDLTTSVTGGIGVGTQSLLQTPAGGYPVDVSADYIALNRNNLAVQP